MKTCVIVGYGRLGRSLANILKDKFTLSIFDIDSDRLIDAKIDGFKTISLDELGQYKLIYLCVPISNFEESLISIKDKLAADTVVIDTCSIKIYPVDLMEKHLPKKVQILATHPLFGPDSIKFGLPGLKFVYSPIRINKTQLDSWLNYWSNKGIVMHKMSPKEHDKQAAYSLAMTHYIGRVLSELKLKRQDIVTVGYDSLLRVIEQTTNDSWQLSHDMLSLNPYVKDMRKDVTGAVNKVEKKLD